MRIMHNTVIPVLDLDPASRAYDQRAVPLAVSRAMTIAGLAFFVAGVWPPLSISFVVFGVGVMLIHICLSLPFWQPRRAWIAYAGGLLAIIYAGLLLLNAILGITVAAGIVSPFPVDAPLREAIATANVHFRDSPWMLARSIAALLAVLLSAELFAAGVRLIRVRSAERHLLVERAPNVSSLLLSFLLDFPPGMIRYSQRAQIGMILLLLGMLPFFFALTNIGGASFLDNQLALYAIIDCVDAQWDVPPCIERAAGVHALGMATLAVTSLFLLPAIGAWLSRRFRTRLARSARQRLNAGRDPDDGDEILFLRPAGDDSVALPAASWTPMRYALSPSTRLTADLDYLLAAEGMVYGIPVALGKEGEAPFGALRHTAVDDGHLPLDEREWVREVKLRAQRAQRIVLAIGESLRDEARSAGLRWELGYIARTPELLAKTTLLVKCGLSHSNSARGNQARLEDYRSLWTLIEELSGLSPPPASKPVIALSFSPGGNRTAMVAHRFYATPALLALRFGLRDSQR